jgi:hypothetical protein
MSAETARKVVESLDKNITEKNLGVPFFGDPRYITYPLTKEGFRIIKDVISNRKIAFVDGGNQEILGAPNFSIQLNRVYCCLFNGGVRIPIHSLPNRVEFLSLTHSVFKSNDIFYETSLFPLMDEFRDLLPDEVDLSFSSSERSVTVGTMRADISRVASIARRFSEWAYASSIVEKELDEGDILVMDGSLQTAFKNESKYSKRLYEKADSHGIIVTGLSKTSHLFTTTGLSLIGAVKNLADDNGIQGKWYFKVAEARSFDHNAVIFVTKLSHSGDYAFRYEIYHNHFLKLNDEEINEIFSQLSKNSVDVGFPGYPYGLIDADYFGKVRKDDVEKFKVLILSEISKLGKWKKFASHIRASDAHAVLDMLEG